MMKQNCKTVPHRHTTLQALGIASSSVTVRLRERKKKSRKPDCTRGVWSGGPAHPGRIRAVLAVPRCQGAPAAAAAGGVSRCPRLVPRRCCYCCCC